MTLIEHPVAGPVLRLTSGDAEALVAPLGAQVVSWRHTGREMLWCASQRLDGKPLRGGIPVCWPWFGAHPSDTSQPSHGLVRNRSWEVRKHSAGSVVMTIAEGPLTATLDVSLGEELRVALTTHNTGIDDVTITAALHTYFAVSDIAQVTVAGLDGASYIDTLDGWSRKQQRGDLRFGAEVDRIYAVGGAVLHDGPRCVEIDSAGTSRSLVAWNPWIAKSARLGDMAEGEYRRMVCLETAWAADDSRALAPGEQQMLTTVLRPIATPP